MPLMRVETNLELTAEQEKEKNAIFSTAVAEMLQKEEKWVMSLVESGRTLSFGGSVEPAAFVELKSIGLRETSCAPLSAQICALLHRELNIPADRVYIEFKDAERGFFGWNGGTFA
ncbi:phenylpyruvate tautomerase MIF-related protein [Desulfobaculum bizertense]|uniref:L-dopachrome isomerase n=1 Tax=Desulfobaculum bizertense DSM 18034 TaxID=1121442 RepID=A0A1T4WES0_9BACT|nr:phenylpyruvate tautomerase MIF-related protein [Desulfobaculum bizertense]UIJ36696.1 phenylpyruvate tautomerase MIF-related protein [Desulfobaculum bizertense]SKA75812.1 Macrophage migration inhibitory factor (MIF) [Desulfobaculum bizertense DSM 18034]